MNLKILSVYLLFQKPVLPNFFLFKLGLCAKDFLLFITKKLVLSSVRKALARSGANLIYAFWGQILTSLLWESKNLLEASAQQQVDNLNNWPDQF